MQRAKPIPKPGDDSFESVRVLYLRLHQRQLSERAEFRTEQLERGAGWRVVVFLAGPRGTPARSGRELARVGPEVTSTPAAERMGEGPSVEAAVMALRKALAADVALRVKSDVGALELAGEPFDWQEGYRGPTVVESPGFITDPPYEQRRPERPVLDVAGEPVLERGLPPKGEPR